MHGTFFQDSTKGYLKLLFLTVVSGDSGNGEAIQRSFELFTSFCYFILLYIDHLISFSYCRIDAVFIYQVFIESFLFVVAVIEIFR